MAKFSVFGNLESLVGHRKKIELNCITVQDGINQLVVRFTEFVASGFWKMAISIPITASSLTARRSNSLMALIQS